MWTWFQSQQPLATVTVVAVLAMSAGSLYRLMTLGSLPPAKAHDRKASLRTWWIILALVLGACWLGPLGVVGLLALASALGMDEFLRITAPMVGPAPRRLWAATMVAVGYGSLVVMQDWSFQFLIPLVAIWTLVLPHLLGDTSQSYMSHVGHSLWGVMVLVWAVAHAGWLVYRDDLANGAAGPIGWFLLLIMLTELNDIAQALVGRALGRHKILPHISPHKTWEGFIGGIIVTMLLSLAASFWLGPGYWNLPEGHRFAETGRWIGPVLGGIVIAVSGFVGDLNMSCVKRDVGVKDGSRMLPGQGGVIDRIDSLSFTAPAFTLFLASWLNGPAS